MTATTHAEFDKSTEALEVAAAFPDAIRDRTVLITGVNRKGIGYATAEAFASQSPRYLILSGRSEAKLQESADGIRAQYPEVKVRILLVDLSSQKSVRAAAAEALNWADIPTFDIVVNNAGVMRHGDTFEGEMPKSEDGIEEQFATNHVGHFLLTNLIMPKIVAAAKSANPGSTRIVNLSSSGAFASPFRASDVHWQTPASELPEGERPRFVQLRAAGMKIDETMSYIPTAAYCHSKCCNVLFSVGLNERLFTKYGILSLALNPGEIRTELSRNTSSDWLERAIKKREEMGLMQWKTQGQGASTTLVASCDPRLSLPEADGTGQYLNDCQIGKALPSMTSKDAAEKLWKISEDLTGEKFSL